MHKPLSTTIKLFLIPAYFLLAAHSQSHADESFNAHVQPVLTQYCHKCHGKEKVKGKVNLLEIKTFAQLAAKPEMAVYMTKTQLRGYARMSAVGEATETDSDMIDVALRSDSARGLFAMPPKR